MIDDKARGYVMTHAGIPPVWSLKQARHHAAEVVHDNSSFNILRPRWMRLRTVPTGMAAAMARAPRAIR